MTKQERKKYKKRKREHQKAERRQKF